MNKSQSIVPLLNSVALKNAIVANTLIGSKVNSKIQSNILNNVASMNVSAANKIIKTTNNVMAAEKTAEAAMKSAVNLSVNTTLNSQQAASKVVKSAMKIANTVKMGNSGSNAIVNASVNAAASVKVNSDPNVAALKVANAALNASLNIKSKSVENVINTNTALINSTKQMLNKSKVKDEVKSLINNGVKDVAVATAKVMPYNDRENLFAIPMKGNKNTIITAQGNTKKFNSTKLNAIINPRGPIKYAKFNGKNKQLSTEIYKQGNLKKMYKNKHGIYTESSGLNGKFKNYVYTGLNTGLFGNNMV
jgi:hypothetical protein